MKFVQFSLRFHLNMRWAVSFKIFMFFFANVRSRERHYILFICVSPRVFSGVCPGVCVYGTSTVPVCNCSFINMYSNSLSLQIFNLDS